MANLRTLTTVQSTDTEGQPGGTTQGVFVTPESLTFPGAALVATGLLQVLRIPFPGADESFWWALGTCALLGLVLYMNSKNPAVGRRQQFVYVTIALINTVLLVGVVLGVGRADPAAPAGATGAGPTEAAS